MLTGAGDSEDSGVPTAEDLPIQEADDQLPNTAERSTQVPVRSLLCVL